jgi:type I restriction-modification system DNA methylase subunit
MAAYFPTNRNLFSEAYLSSHFFLDCADFEIESKSAYAALVRLRKESAPDRFAGGQESQLREEYIDKVLDILGWFRSGEGRIPEDGKPDYTLFATQHEKNTALSHVGGLEFFERALAVCEAKPWATSLLEKPRGSETPRGQIYRYLEDTHLPWGFLTNGKEWLLIWREYSRAQQRDYLVDLDTLLLEGLWTPEFNFFFAMFRKTGVSDGFLLQAIEKSRVSGEVVGRNLKSSVHQALLIVGRAIYSACPSNYTSEDDLTTLKANCLTLLYRLLFVNYAESRKLLPMKESDLYRRTYSLLRVKESIQRAAPRMQSDEYAAISSEKHELYLAIKKLFKAIDQGLPLAHIPQYNGGLFRSSDHPFLDEVNLDDRTVARTVDLLSRFAEDPERFVDYSYLGVRELGSIYEGLLEFRFQVAENDLIAVPNVGDGTEVWVPFTSDLEALRRDGSNEVRKGELYLTTERGERKSSGSFYTPDEVVRYIVQQALGPVVDRKLKAAKELGEDPQLALLNLKVLDPAMGSGHFLVAATEYLAERLLDCTEQGPESLHDSKLAEDLEAWAKRQIVSHCIYGVDLNSMAVELAKVSLWLTTFSRGLPLSFLDHRLKTGNSLFGTRLEELATFPRSDTRAHELPIVSGPRVKKFDITGLVEEFRQPVEAIEAIDETTVQDVERKKTLYLDFVNSPKYGRVIALANAQVAAWYKPPEDLLGASKKWDKLVEAAVRKDTEEWVDFVRAGALRDGYETARAKKPFHWDLEFPEVFARASPGFDAVIGNPPYVRIYRGQLSREDVTFYQRRFRAAYMKFDLYVLFLELGLRLTRKGGRLGFIVPDKFATSPYGEPVRELILRNRLISLLDLRRESVFPGVAVSTLVPIMETGAPANNKTKIFAPTSGVDRLDSMKLVAEVEQENFLHFPQSQIRIDAAFSELELLTRVLRASLPLEKAYYVNWGLRTGTEERTERLITATPQGKNPKPLLRGEDVRGRYLLVRPARFIDYDTTQLYNPMFAELFERPKLVFRKISGPEGIRAALDESGAYCFSTLICAVSLTELRKVKRVGVHSAGREARRLRDPALVLAICNSRLVSWWYKQTYSDALGVNPGHVQAIPLPRALLEETQSDRLPYSNELQSGDPSSGLGEVESSVSAGGLRLQKLGDEICAEATGFFGWLARELGPAVSAKFARKAVENLEHSSEEELITHLESLHQREPLRMDPHLRDSQDLILGEFRRARARVVQLREQFAALDLQVEKSIHRLFGLSTSDSDRILQAASEAPVLSTSDTL